VRYIPVGDEWFIECYKQANLAVHVHTDKNWNFMCTNGKCEGCGEPVPPLVEMIARLYEHSF
jgi:hypothetical protein